MLESAIPDHLLTQHRTVPSRLPNNGNHEPPYPSYVSRFSPSIKDMVLAQFGIQYASPDDDDGAASSKLWTFLNCSSSSEEEDENKVAAAGHTLRPSHKETAIQPRDSHGFYNKVILAYWPSSAAYYSWAEESGFQAWWDSLDDDEEQEEEEEKDKKKKIKKNGWFLEVLLPTSDRIETIFTSPTIPEGAGHMRDGVSGLVKEHAYWGSMRDRLAVSQVDELLSSSSSSSSSSPPKKKKKKKEEVGNEEEEEEEEEEEGGIRKEGKNKGKGKKKMIRVAPKKNLCVIRSGQDWSACLPEEKKLYLETLHPVMIKGMDFLRDNSGGGGAGSNNNAKEDDEKQQLGCHSCRFMEVVVVGGEGEEEEVEKKTEKTFGLAYFDDIASLERWSREHPTHLAIFGGFFQYAKKLENKIDLRLFHEVAVLDDDQEVVVGEEDEEGDEEGGQGKGKRKAQQQQQIWEYVGCHSGTGMLTTL